MRTIKNRTQILIGGDAAVSTGNTLNDGEIGVFNAETGARVTTAGQAATANKVFFMQGRTYAGKSAPLKSNVVDLARLRSSIQDAYSADQEQISYVGYDGTSGAIDLLANTSYYLRFAIQELIVAHSDGRDFIQSNFLTGTTALGSRIAEGLALTFQNSMKKRPQKLAKIEVLCNVTSAAPGGTTANAVVAKGSKAVVLDAAAGAAVAAGNFLRLGGNAVTDPVYRIDSVNGLIVTLDRPYEGDDATLLVASNEIETIADGTGAGESDETGAAAWGLKITGEPLPFAIDQVKKRRWYKSRFTVTMDAGDTQVYESQPPLDGSGTWQSIAIHESFAQGDDQEMFRMGEPYLHPTRQTAVSGENYQTLSLHFDHAETVGFQDNISQMELVVAVPDDTSSAAYVTDGTNGLNVIFAALPTALPVFT